MSEVTLAAARLCPGCGNSLPATEALCAICERRAGGRDPGSRGPGALTSWVLTLAGLGLLFALGWAAGH